MYVGLTVIYAEYLGCDDGYRMVKYWKMKLCTEMSHSVLFVKDIKGEFYSVSLSIWVLWDDISFDTNLRISSEGLAGVYGAGIGISCHLKADLVLQEKSRSISNRGGSSRPSMYDHGEFRLSCILTKPFFLLKTYHQTSNIKDVRDPNGESLWITVDRSSKSLLILGMNKNRLGEGSRVHRPKPPRLSYRGFSIEHFLDFCKALRILNAIVGELMGG